MAKSTVAAPDTARPKSKLNSVGRDEQLFVLDTTAVDAPRTHEMIVDGVVRAFTFERGKPLALPPIIALKFLRHEAFLLVNERGEAIPYQRRPRQPDEMPTNTPFVLAPNETVARFDELTGMALYQRAVELPGGEKFTPDDRNALIEFLIAARKAEKPAAELDEEEFTPAPEPDEDLAA